MHYYNPQKRKYQASFLYPVHPSQSDAQITSIVVSKNMQLLQTLYVVYKPSVKGKKTFIKVFK